MAKKAMKSMKAMKGVKSMPKGAIADALATACEKKRSEMSKVLDALAELAGKEAKKTGKFTIPGVCMIKTRHKPATKACKRMAFGKEVKCKAKPARTILKCFAAKVWKQCEAGLSPPRLGGAGVVGGGWGWVGGRYMVQGP